MAIEGVRDVRYSPHLPRPEAWKEPERWINLKTGRPLSDIEKIQLPTDNRGIINTDRAVELVKTTLFQDDYDWSQGGRCLLTR